MLNNNSRSTSYKREIYMRGYFAVALYCGIFQIRHIVHPRTLSPFTYTRLTLVASMAGNQWNEVHTRHHVMVIVCSYDITAPCPQTKKWQNQTLFFCELIQLIWTTTNKLMTTLGNSASKPNTPPGLPLVNCIPGNNTIRIQKLIFFIKTLFLGQIHRATYKVNTEIPL